MPDVNPPTSPPITPLSRAWRVFWFLLTVDLILLVLNVTTRLPRGSADPARPGSQPPSRPEPPNSFEGDSDRLARTVILPSPESVIPEGKSAIRCATLPMAWQQYERDVAKGPLRLEGADEVSRSLSRAPLPRLDPEHHYIAAGFVRDGIFERIERDLTARFPKAPRPQRANNTRAVAYAYLEAAIAYAHPFPSDDHPLTFTDGQGRETRIAAFGIDSDYHYAGETTFRGQVEVLFQDDKEFAIDPSKDTRPYQVVLAEVRRRPTLQETWNHVRQRIQEGKPTCLDREGILLIPKMRWRVEHRFRELEGKGILNPGLGGAFDQVWQSVELKMDRTGTYATSTAMPRDWSQGGGSYYFNTPYLIALRRRGDAEPFFLMWVDNVELLQKAGG